MAKLPRIKGEEAVKAFGNAGFVLDRIRGSHHILRHPAKTARLSIPVHNACLGPGLLRAQIRAAGMTVEEFIGLL